MEDDCPPTPNPREEGKPALIVPSPYSKFLESIVIHGQVLAPNEQVPAKHQSTKLRLSAERGHGVGGLHIVLAPEDLDDLHKPKPSLAAPLPICFFLGCQ